MNSDNPQFEASPAYAPPEKDVAILATGAGIALVGRVGGRGLYAITEIMLARILGPTVFGLYAIGLNLLRIVGTIGMLGLQNGVIRFGVRFGRSSPSGLKTTLHYALGLSVTSGVFLGMTLFLLAPWLAIQVFSKPELVLVFRRFALAFPLAIGLWVAASATRISKRIKYSVFAEDVVQPAANLLLVIVFALFGLTLSRAVSINVFSYGIAAGLAIYFIKILFPEALASPAGSDIVVKEILFYSLPAGLAGTFTFLTSWIGRLFVGYYRPAEEAGIYQAASQISLIFVIILSALNAIFAPMIADLFHRKEIGRIEVLYKISTKWGLYIVIPLFLVICFLPQEFMVTIFGEDYASGAIPLVILATTQVVNVGTGAVGFLLTMTGHQNRWFVTSGLAMSLTLILNALLIPVLGMTGSALATAIAVSGLYFGGLVQVKIILGLRPYDRRYIKGLYATGLAAGVLFLINRLVHLPSPVTAVVVSSIISAGTFGLVLLLLGLDAEDREFIRVVSTRINNLRILNSKGE